MTINDILRAVGITIAAPAILVGFMIFTAWLVQVHEWMSWPRKDGKK